MKLLNIILNYVSLKPMNKMVIVEAHVFYLKKTPYKPIIYPIPTCVNIDSMGFGITIVMILQY